MTNQPPRPGLDALIDSIGVAAERLDAIQATEGAAGNISIGVCWPLDLAARFPDRETMTLPERAPELAGVAFLVSGSGCRLAAIRRDPEANLGVVVVDPGGETATLHTAPRRGFRRVTSEFNTHFALHREAMAAGAVYQAVIHAQPPSLTFLSHIARYQDEATFNRRLLRWQPELIFQFPNGIGVVPFLVPGSARLAQLTAERMRGRTLVVWAKHGIIARSTYAIEHASDHIEYAEAGARYEQLNLMSGEPAEGLSVEEMLAICREHGVAQTVFPEFGQPSHRGVRESTVALELGGPALSIALSLNGRRRRSRQPA
jgi:rhamnulose-1-phosphate aldolase